jgi:hypothetical protein
MNESISARSPQSLPWLALGSATAVFAVIQFSLLPHGVIAYNDDFGYLRSIVETAARHSPWTDDWLEPWAASLSAISAAVWRLTGSFRAAVHGTQVIAISLGYLAASALFVRRGFSVVASLAVSALLLSMPTILWKDLEFTGFFLNVACLLAAVYFIEHRRWGWFAAAAAVALASRQSAIAWLALPGWAIIKVLWKRANLRSLFSPLVAILAVCACYAVCSIALNRTHAQEVMTSAMCGDRLGFPQY